MNQVNFIAKFDSEADKEFYHKFSKKWWSITDNTDLAYNKLILENQPKFS